MKLRLEITENEKLFLYEILKAVFLRTLITIVAIGLGYVLTFVGFIKEVNFQYVAGVMFVTLFNFGRDYQKTVFNIKKIL